MAGNSKSTSFLGTGWSFPPEFSRATGSVSLVSDREDIEQSLQILLATRPGERIMQPDYGCNLDKLMFEPLDTTLITYVEDLVKKAILYHEPRINPESVKVAEDTDQPGLLNVKVEYTIRTTNSRYNFVYPFYRESTGQSTQ
jgi:hypothetical protein